MTDAPKPSLSVVGAVGRYPATPGRLDPCNLHVQVTDYADAVVIRLEDEAHADFWLELTLKAGGPCVSP